MQVQAGGGPCLRLLVANHQNTLCRAMTAWQASLHAICWVQRNFRGPIQSPPGPCAVRQYSTDFLACIVDWNRHSCRKQ